MGWMRWWPLPMIGVTGANWASFKNVEGYVDTLGRLAGGVARYQHCAGVDELPCLPARPGQTAHHELRVEASARHAPPRSERRPRSTSWTRSPASMCRARG